MIATGDTLTVDGLSAAYGDTQVLWDVSISVAPGEVVALIGSNGAGKSSLLGAISGLVDVLGGSVRFGDADITGLKPDRVVTSGVSQVAHGRRLVSSPTVEENLLMGAYLRNDKEVDADVER